MPAGSKREKPNDGQSRMGFLMRWGFAFVLIAATYNPTAYNFISWATGDLSSNLPLKILAGLILFVGYVVYLRATLRSIGTFGMILVAAIFCALIWVLVDYGILSLADTQANAWIGILALSLVLGIGLSWSFVRRAISGQYDVDDSDE